MLARYLREVSKPVRYAMDPVHEAAIRNYLALMTRAYDLPQLYQQARPHLPGGHQGSLLHQLFTAMISEHDPHALAAFLDAHQEMTGQQPHPIDFGAISHDSDHSAEMLPRSMASLHGVLSGGGHPLGVHDAVPRFAPGRLANQDLRDSMNDAYLNRHGPMSSLEPLLHRLTQALGSGTATMRPMSSFADRADAIYDEPAPTGDPHGFVQLHDLVREIQQSPSARPIHGLAGDIRGRTSDILRHVAVRHLLSS